MVKIAVFDSGFGSLSVIKAIQRETKLEIIYFADQKNFPYGNKTKNQLKKIITDTVDLLKSKFNPDLSLIGSNTPTILLDKVLPKKVVGVLPPLKEAANLSSTKNIAILATKLVINSRELSKFIKSCHLPKRVNITKIDASALINLIESGKFIDKPKICQKIISKILKPQFNKKCIDVATLSSTHLPFLKTYLQKEFPNIVFLDPAQKVAKKVANLTSKNKSKKNSLKIYTSGDPKKFQKYLRKIGFKNKVSYLPLS